MPRLCIIRSGSTLPESNRLMTRTRAAVLATLIASLSSFAPTALSAAADRIWQKSGGRPITGTVSQDHYDEVKYRRGTTDLTLPGSKVRAIDYGDAPESYEDALETRDEGDFENAVSLFKASMTERVRDWIKVAAPYEIGETCRMWGARDRSKYKSAIESYDAALAANPKTRSRPAILFGRAQAKLGAGDLDGALADFDTLVTESVGNKYGTEWELKALYEKAKALDEGGRPDDAKRAFSALEKTARSLSTQTQLDEGYRKMAAEHAGLARLEQGRVLIRDGRGSQAETFFKTIVSDTAEIDAVRAAALVGLGHSLQAQKKLKEAQMAFAQVRVRYFSNPDAVAEATYGLGLVSEELGPAEPKGSKLAQDYFLEVAQRFSGTRWAQKAQEKLN